ncbi:MAG TPA: type II toxin-antitoxin system PemK/MazF family toxin [Terracidiphilus sp.]|jgi:mRNA interferase MazF|nr:type II toxin-antitoxin system PemK/MazF family toxin [Terracidiphilus sp.]
MVAAYVPDAGDIVFLDFDPQIGREQAKRRPALVLTDMRYNRASGLAVVCPLTSRRKPYPFALPVTVDRVEGATLVDQLKSFDWAGRHAEFHSKASAALLTGFANTLGFSWPFPARAANSFTRSPACG